jgi:sugar O-acyltransferase (sialic acid O-acetyltransferase NeuD family)
VSNLLVLGAGGHGRVVAEAAADRFSKIAFLDDKSDRTETGTPPIIGSLAELVSHKEEYSHAVVAIGNNEQRLAMIERLLADGFQVTSVVHQSAVVSPSAIIEDGCVILAQAVVGAGARIGRGSIVNTSASIDHDCILGEGVHVSPGAHLAGSVSVGARTWIGIGAAVRECAVIGSDVVVGAGAAVVADVAPGITVTGVPARPD